MNTPKSILKDLSASNKEILDAEYKSFLLQIESCSSSYYVYILYGLGNPFYVGKGKGLRAYEHLKIKDDSIKSNHISYLYSINEPPVVFILEDGLSEKKHLN